MFCPNLSDPEVAKKFRALESIVPEYANYLWNKYQGEVPSKYYNLAEAAKLFNQEVKPGVEELFNENPELTSIGTPQQYSAYLDTIFPDSKVKDIVYHGGTVKDVFTKENIGKSTINSNKNDFGQPNAFYFTTSIESAKTYGEIKKIILNIEDPVILEQSLEDKGFGLKRKNKFTDVQNLNLKNRDGFILKDIFDAKSLETLSTKDLIEDDGTKQKQLNAKIESQYGDTIGVFEPEQIHILSSKADIQGFKDYMAFQNSEFAKYGTYEQFRQFIISKSSMQIENRLIETGKINRVC